jgi:hypothetical protein
VIDARAMVHPCLSRAHETFTHTLLCSRLAVAVFVGRGGPANIRCVFATFLAEHSGAKNEITPRHQLDGHRLGVVSVDVDGSGLGKCSHCCNWAAAATHGGRMPFVMVPPKLTFVSVFLVHGLGIWVTVQWACRALWIAKSRCGTWNTVTSQRRLTLVS